VWMMVLMSWAGVWWGFPARAVLPDVPEPGWASGSGVRLFLWYLQASRWETPWVASWVWVLAWTNQLGWKPAVPV
jgi:hypothetical protein